MPPKSFFDFQYNNSSHDMSKDTQGRVDELIRGLVNLSVSLL